MNSINRLEEDFKDNYEISARPEVLSILRGICDQGALISFSFNFGDDFLLTTILSISADGTAMILDRGANMKMNRKALLADRINCESRKENVKIRFVLHRLTAVSHDGREAFLAAVPDSLIRLQRRKHYRLAIPKASPLTACVPLRREDGVVMLLRAELVDISGGGMCIRMPVDKPCLDSDMELFGVTFVLPGIGGVAVDMRVRNIHDETMANGRILRRAVCEFIALPNPTMNLIQRYIFKVQRERLARVAGRG